MYHFFFHIIIMRNVVSITFSQQILDDKLFLAVTGGQETNFSGGHILDSIIVCYQRFILKM